MHALPIPGGGGTPGLGIVFAIAAAVVFVAIVVQAVRSFRNSGDRHDVFGPPLDGDRPADDERPAPPERPERPDDDKS
jgi:hypothetical protein